MSDSCCVSAQGGRRWLPGMVTNGTLYAGIQLLGRLWCNAVSTRVAREYSATWDALLPPDGHSLCHSSAMFRECDEEYFSMEYCLRATCDTLLPAEAIDSWFLIVSHMP